MVLLIKYSLRLLVPKDLDIISISFSIISPLDVQIKQQWNHNNESFQHNFFFNNKVLIYLL